MTLFGLKVPSWKDARWVQTVILTGYAVVARQLFNIERPHLAAVICVAWAVFLDLLLGRFYFRKMIFPLSAVIIGLSSSILIDPRHWGYYLLVITLAVLSKVFITVRGKHFFNPSNFGVVVCIQLLPMQVSAIPQLFSGYLWPSVVFFVLGVATVLWARQWPVSFSWMAGFAAFAVYRALKPGGSAWIAFGPMFSSAFLLFTFHMISDPATVPRTTGFKIAFGLLAAFIDGLLRVNQVPHGQLYALLVASACLPLLRAYEDQVCPPVRAPAYT